MMRYLPHTPEEIADMLRAVGAPDVDALFAAVPPEARYKKELDVGPALDEPGLMRHLGELAARNTGAGKISFLGAGAYDHHIPPAVDQLLLRGEFYTAYTPYQPEVAQGTLQAIFEFQTTVSEIFGLPLANASLYDGASATAEAVLMARRLTRREKVVLSEGVHPQYRDVVATFLRSAGLAEGGLVTVPVGADGADDVEALAKALSPEVAAVVVGYPSFFGTVGDVRAVVERARAAGAQVVTATADPYALALLESPGALGADIAVGEGQPIACPPQFGGPGVGLFACRESRETLQQIPGRLCGRTVDKNGQTGYVLTLVTREQFIRRERATSNICTNQGLLALSFTIRAALLGKRGFVETARHCLAKAEYLKAELAKLPGYELAYPQAKTFNEFALRVPGGDAAAVVERARHQGVLAGYPLGEVDPARKGQLLVAVTERHTRHDLDRLAEVLGQIG
ncbi:MAG TPA: aminomethyl-transferring glycine dehydrogenase subunit GcvPA [Polyangiaceae bacterium]|nr:aminomethyl-transferring glycine dehydrogenase subunit GcvPA [Polyangiaceae bacterium]